MQKPTEVADRQERGGRGRRRRRGEQLQQERLCDGVGEWGAADIDPENG